MASKTKKKSLKKSKPKKKRRSRKKKFEIVPLTPKEEIKIEEEIKAETTDLKVKEARRHKKTLMLAKCSMEQIKEHLDLAIKATEIEEPVEAIRAWYNINCPGMIFCIRGYGNPNLMVCEYSCKRKCGKYLDKRYICNIARSENDVKHKCESRNYKCKSFKLVEYYIDRYIMLYAPVHEMNLELNKKGKMVVPKRVEIKEDFVVDSVVVGSTKPKKKRKSIKKKAKRVKK